MLSYMEKKYKEPFTAMTPYAGQFGKDYTMLKVKSKSGKKGILVRVSGEGEGVYQDNYLAYLLKDEIEQRIRKLARPIFGECKVFYRIPELVFPTYFPADMDVDAFLRHPDSKVRVYIYVKNLPTDRQGQFDAFLKVLQEKGYILGGIITYPEDEKMFGMITKDNFTGDIYQGYRSLWEAVFSMGDEGELLYLEWKGGDLNG